MKKRKLDKNKVITYIFLASIAIIFFLSLASYDPGDPVGFFQEYKNIITKNLFSSLGATIAAPVFENTFGYGSLVFPFLLLFLIYANYMKIYFNQLLDFSAKILILGLWIGILLALPQAFVSGGSFNQYYPSGEFSALILKVFFLYTGSFGTVFILLATFLLYLLWILRDVTIFLKTVSAIKNGSSFIIYKSFYFLKKIVKTIKIKKKTKEKAEEDDFIIEEFNEYPEFSDFYKKNEFDIEISEKNKINQAKNEEVSIHKEIDSDEQAEIEKVIANKFKKENHITSNHLLDNNLVEEDIIETYPQKEALSDENKDDDILLLKRIKRVKEEKIEKENYDFEVEGPHVEKELKIEKFIEHQLKKYEFPSIELLDYNEENVKKVTREELEFNAQLLIETLSHFNVEAIIVRVMEGPVVTQYQLKPAKGVKIAKIVTLQDDLALALKARGIRIIAPIPGKSAVGIEIPNRNRSIVYLKTIIRSERFVNFQGGLPVVLGKMINGEIYCDDLTEMPHLLLAGATGTGKSVGLNILIASIIYRIPPSDVKFILIDPKRLEFSLYENLKNHYLAYCPELDEQVITEPDNAVLMLQSLILEMEKRYQMLKELMVRNISEYNFKIKNGLDRTEKYVYEHKHLPYLVVIIDELADLMLSSAKEVEEPIARLTQKARAAGIHLIVATQRPSVNVITGVIKTNFPVRIAYQVPQKIDSKVILDLLGAEQLIGKGDMLLKSPAFPKPIRLQTPLIEAVEIDRIVKHIKKQPHFPPYELQLPAKGDGIKSMKSNSDFIDPLFEDARKIVILHKTGSASLLQRKLRIGYTRAASILDQLEDSGIVGPSLGSKAREVYVEKLDDF